MMEAAGRICSVSPRAWSAGTAGDVGSCANAADASDACDAAGDDGAPLAACCSRCALGDRGVPKEPLGLTIKAPGLRPYGTAMLVSYNHVTQLETSTNACLVRLQRPRLTNGHFRATIIQTVGLTLGSHLICQGVVDGQRLGVE